MSDMWLTGLSSGLVLEKAQVRKKESSPVQTQNNLILKECISGSVVASRIRIRNYLYRSGNKQKN
jgi:hypothetical protein